MNRGRRIQIIRWLPSVLWMALIFYLSHQPGESLNSMLPVFQRWLPQLESFNAGHFVAYFILALAVYWGMGERAVSLWGKLLTVLICTFYGLTDEYHQLFIEGRMADWLDVRNDAIGAILAMLVISIPPFERWYVQHGTFQKLFKQNVN